MSEKLKNKLDRLKQHYDPDAALKARDWRKDWGPEHDYVDPDYDVSQHPALRGDVMWVQHSSSRGLDMRSASSLDADFAHAEKYDQEPLPGQWLFYGRAE